MVVLHCSPNDFVKCKNCLNRESEEDGLDEALRKYKAQHPEKSFRRCAICGHSRGLYIFDEKPAHPNQKYFCELRQRYLSGDGLCGWYCFQ